MSRIIGLKTYKTFAKKYKIRLSYVINNKRKQKTMAELREAIYKYETENPDKFDVGLYYT